MHPFLRIASPRLLTPLVALLLAAPLTRAGESEKKETASFRFVRFAEMPPVGAMNSDGKFDTLEIHPNFIGRPVRLNVKDPIPLLPLDDKGVPRKDDGKAADPVLTFSPLHDAPRQLVVIYDEEKTLVAQGIHDSPKKFPFGRILVVNRTESALVMEVGGVSSKLPPKETTLCETSAKVATMTDIAVRLTTDDDKKPKLLYSTVWPGNPKVRTLAFIHKNENGRIVMRTVTDANVPEVAEAAPTVEPPAPAVTPAPAAAPAGDKPPEAKPAEKTPDAPVPEKN